MAEIKTVSSFFANPTVKGIPFSFSDSKSQKVLNILACPCSHWGRGWGWWGALDFKWRGWSKDSIGGLNCFLPGFFWGRKKENLASIFLGYLFRGGGAGDGCLKPYGLFGFWFLPLFDRLRHLKSEVPFSRPSSQNLHDHRRTWIEFPEGISNQSHCE